MIKHSTLNINNILVIILLRGEGIIIVHQVKRSYLLENVLGPSPIPQLKKSLFMLGRLLNS